MNEIQNWPQALVAIAIIAGLAWVLTTLFKGITGKYEK